jgi:hypothetical protein
MEADGAVAQEAARVFARDPRSGGHYQVFRIFNASSKS